MKSEPIFVFIPKLTSVSNKAHTFVMWWKIYFWGFLALNLYSSYLLLSQGGYFLTVILSVFLSLGLNVITYFYAFHKPIPSISFIRTIYWLNLLFLVINILYQTIPLFNTLVGPVEPTSLVSLVTTLVGYLPSLPAFYVCHKLLSTRKNPKKQTR